MKKYELIESDKVLPSGRPLFQVVALQDFGFVKKGDKGGYIESEANLSHEGNCWVSDDARVFDAARVFGTAQVCYTAWVYGNARVCDNARVDGTARVYGLARVYGDVWVASGRAFATKNDDWDITEVDNGDGTVTLYADATFEPEADYCPKCGKKL